MTGDLLVATDALYRTFATYVRPKWFEGCGCCWGSGEPLPDRERYQGGTIRILGPGKNTDLRRLTVEDLSEVASNVPHLGGDVDVLRHYLPRILEILMTEGFQWPDFEPVLERLTYGADLGGSPWWTWPAEEQKAINRFLEAAWTALLRDTNEVLASELSADTFLCGIGNIVDDIRPYLTKWSGFDEPFAARHLQEFLNWNRDLTTGGLSNPFWTREAWRASRNMRQIVRWVHSRETLEELLAVLDQPRSAEEQDAIEAVFATLTGNDAFGAGILEQAVERGDEEKVRALIDAGVDPNEVDQLSSTPIWLIAFGSGRYEIASLFARAGADVEIVDSRGKSLLHRLASQGPKVEPVRRALALGVSHTTVDRHGWSALHGAAAYGHTEIVRELLAAGADPNVKTTEGKKPIDFARTNNHASVAKILAPVTSPS
jgi:uncharacterized protein